MVRCIVVPSQTPSAHFVARCRWKPRLRPLWKPGFFSRFLEAFGSFVISSFYFVFILFHNNVCLKTQKMWSLPLLVLTFCCAALQSSDSGNMCRKPHRRDLLRAGAPSFDHVVTMRSSAGRQDTLYGLGMASFEFRIVRFMIIFTTLSHKVCVT